MQPRTEKKTAGTHRNASSVLKNTTIKLSKYVVNQKLEHVGDISFRELSGRINPMTSYLYLGTRY
jgi:hypothetical protein